MQSRITGLIDSELADWRSQVYGLLNPSVTAIYKVISIGNVWYYTKALSAGNNSTTLFVGPWSSQEIAIDMMNNAQFIDGF